MGRNIVRHAKNLLVWVIIIIGWGIGILMLMHNNRTEVYSQRRSLEAFCSVSNQDVERILLAPRPPNPEIVELYANKDGKDIKKLMSAIRNDLWVSRREINPYNDNRPGYDEIILYLKNKERLFLYVWFGKEGGENVSLAMRSRTGEFKRVVQDIMRRKENPISTYLSPY